jgi:hypothetical protein
MSDLGSNMFFQHSFSMLGNPTVTCQAGKEGAVRLLSLCLLAQVFVLARLNPVDFKPADVN